MQTTRARRLALMFATTASVVAIAVHGYLALVHYEVQYGDATGDRICNVGEAFNCEAVSASRWAEFLGVPMAIWGIAFNAVFLGLLAAWAIAEPDKKRGRAAATLALAGLILGASVAMGGISALAMSKYCLFCMVAYALSAVGFAGAWIGLWPEAKEKPKAIGAPGLLASALRPAAIALAIGVFAAFLGNWKVIGAYGAQDLGPIVKGAIDDWVRTPAIAVNPVAPLVKGASAEAAKLTIVEFADFRCSHCKHAAPTFDAFAASSPDVRFLFQPWPLDGACNPKIPGANGASCSLARASYCAAKFGRAGGQGEKVGWAAHKWMFDHQDSFVNQESIDKAMAEMTAELKLDAAGFQACVSGDEAKDAVAKQAAIDLDVPGTPTVYANGRKLGYAQIMAVLRGALERAGEAPPANRP